MCEICYFIEDNKPRREWKERGGTKDDEPRAHLLYPFPGGAEDITNYMSSKFKIRYCPKCGRRFK